MLVAFIGPPCSGKTTAAARLFADLKERGLPVEFLTEYARMYIALRRRFCQDSDLPPLDDRDQYAIFVGQDKNEAIMAHDPTSLVIADSSAVSALLYMTDEFIEAESKRDPVYGVPNAIERAKRAAARYDIIFRCSPVHPGLVYDPNRVHSYEQSVALDARISKVFNLVGVDPKRVFPLFGDPKMRVSEAGSVVLRAHVERLAASATKAAQ